MQLRDVGNSDGLERPGDYYLKEAEWIPGHPRILIMSCPGCGQLVIHPSRDITHESPLCIAGNFQCSFNPLHVFHVNEDEATPVTP